VVAQERRSQTGRGGKGSQYNRFRATSKSRRQEKRQLTEYEQGAPRGDKKTEERIREPHGQDRHFHLKRKKKGPQKTDKTKKSAPRKKGRGPGKKRSLGNGGENVESGERIRQKRAKKFPVRRGKEHGVGGGKGRGGSKRQGGADWEQRRNSKET